MENNKEEQVLNECKKQIAEKYQCDSFEEVMDALIPSDQITAIDMLCKLFASQERLKGITEGFNAAREKQDYVCGKMIVYNVEYKHPTPEDYINSKP